MNNKNNNYRVMKFLEPVNKKDKCKGYVRLDIRGARGVIMVSVEDVGDSKTTSDVYLYKNKSDRIKIGTVNNKKGMIKKNMLLGNNFINIEDYNICGVVKDDRIILYSNLFNDANLSDIRKLEETVSKENCEDDVEVTINTEDAKCEIESNCDAQEIEDSEIEIETDESGCGSEENELKGTNETNETDELIEAEVNEGVESSEENLSMNGDDLNGQHENYEQDVESASRKTGRKNKFEENLYNILGDSNRIEPLSVNIKNLAWWKVIYDDRSMKSGLLPFYNQIISSYYPYPMSNRVTTCQGLIKKYGHYIFGVYKENNVIKRFVYGVPGEFKREEQPYKGITGFKNWSYKNKDTDGMYGYWIAFVDSNTGEVTEPPQIDLGK